MRGKNKMYVFLGCILIFIGILIVFFNISYSKTRIEFNKLSNALILKSSKTEEVFSESDIVDLPASIQKYFKASGFIGKTKMSYMKIEFNNVKFSLGKDKPNIKVDYYQYNFVNEPNRIAYIDSKMYGIPFQGLDSYVDGVGSMKGVLAKVITLFNQKGISMDKASLVTYLAECLFIPSAAIQDFISWEEIDEFHVKATISYYGISASGIFTFNENYEMLSFNTFDRESVGMDGKVDKVPWTALCSNYKVINGIKQPTSLQAIWHYETGDLIYFDSNNFKIYYDNN